MKRVLIAVLGMIILSSSLSYADVKNVSETVLNLEGAMGSMMKLFGAAKPVKSVDYYKDQMKRSDSFDKKGELESSQIINMKEELFITVDHKRETYTQMTFDEWREMFESTMKQFDQGDVEADAVEESAEPEAEVEWDLKVDVKKTGNEETIAGKKCEEVVLTLDMDAEVTGTNEETQEEETANLGMVVTSNQWLFKGGDKAKKEMDDFNFKLAEKLGMFTDQMSIKDMMSQVLVSNPQLGEAMEKLQKEGDKLDGLAMRTVTVFETKVDPETAKKINEEKAKEEDEDVEIPTSVGGLIGGFGKKLAKKKMQPKQEVKERNALMNSETTILELSTSALDAGLFSAPSTYTLKENDQ